MNVRLLLMTALALLLLPLASAQAPGASVDEVTVRLDESTMGNDVVQDIEIEVTDAAAMNASAGFELALDDAATGLNATMERGGQSRGVTLQETAAGGPYKTYRANLSAAFADLRTGDRLLLRLSYSTDASFGERLAYGAGQLVVYGSGQGDNVPASDQLGAFNPTHDGNEQHAVRSGVAPGFAYTVTFVKAQDAAQGGARDMNPYILFVVGALAGFLVAWFLLKRSPKAKKFEKGGEMESSAMLEARRRTLMAALKELELAHEAKEIPDTAYAPLKEEYKAQTVRVLRSIEDKKESTGAKP